MEVHALFLMICLPAFVSTSRSILYFAAHQPDRKDMTAIEPGALRSIVRTESGTPVWSGKDNGTYVEGGLYESNDCIGGSGKHASEFFNGDLT